MAVAMNEDIDSDLEIIMETGDRLPPEMYESAMPDTIMENPVFDGEKIVDEGSE